MESLRTALREHWPEYLIEGWALGCFMLSIGFRATFLFAPSLPIAAWSGEVRTLLLALVPRPTGRARECCGDARVSETHEEGRIAVFGHAPWFERSFVEARALSR